MIRTCDGTDKNLLQEQVDRVAASGTESMHWVPCDCGLVFDDVERLVVYPHHFIPSREDKAELLALVDQMVKDNKTSEEIRQALQLTSHSVGAKVEDNTTTTEGSPMGEGNEFDRTEQVESVSAEGTEADESSAATDSSAEGADEDAAADAPERKSQGY